MYFSDTLTRSSSDKRQQRGLLSSSPRGPSTQQGNMPCWSHCGRFKNPLRRVRFPFLLIIFYQRRISPKSFHCSSIQKLLLIFLGILSTVYHPPGGSRILITSRLTIKEHQTKRSSTCSPTTTTSTPRHWPTGRKFATEIATRASLLLPHQVCRHHDVHLHQNHVHYFQLTLQPRKQT